MWEGVQPWHLGEVQHGKQPGDEHQENMKEIYEGDEIDFEKICEGDEIDFEKIYEGDGLNFTNTSGEYERNI